MVEITEDRTLNFEKLAKGDFISVEVIREITGHDPRENEQVYKFDLLNCGSPFGKTAAFQPDARAIPCAS